MYRNHRIGLVIPARNEERLIGATLDAVPDHVDAIFVVDDGSTDRTAALVEERRAASPRIELLVHGENRGPGAGIVTGYRRAAEAGCEVVAVVGGDNQMPMDQLARLLDPIIDGRADYVKGNRFLEGGNAIDDMPKIRFVGNMIISALTKVSSGYYKIYDFVDGFTAISRRAIEQVDWRRAWPGYGYPMQFLILFNYYGLRVLDVPRRAIYLKGERQSQIRGVRYALRVAPMLVRGFFWRIFRKYCLRSFHPLFFFFTFGGLLGVAGFGLGLSLIYREAIGMGVTAPQSVLCALFLIMGCQFVLFAMLFDMEEGLGR